MGVNYLSICFFNNIGNVCILRLCLLFLDRLFQVLFWQGAEVTLNIKNEVSIFAIKRGCGINILFYTVYTDGKEKFLKSKDCY